MSVKKQPPANPRANSEARDETAPSPGADHDRRLLEAVCDRATVAFFVMDERHHCTYMNRAAEKLTGYTLAEMQGRTLHSVVHHTRPDGSPYPPEECTVGQTLTENNQEHGEDFFVRRDGSFYPVAYTASAFVKDGARVGTVVEARDASRRKRTEESLAERARTAMLAADVGLALTQGATIRDTLQRCAEAIVEHLDAAFARVWTLDAEEKVLELQASAGMYTHTDGAHGRVPVGKFKIGLIAEERKAHLTNSVVGDPRVGDQEWARREGMVAFAGYPLIVDDEVVGVMAMFARRALSETTLEAMSAVANGIALGVERKRAEEGRESLREEVIRMQQSLLAELSTPLIPLKDRIVVMPLIGAMSAERAAQMLETLLSGVTARGARVAIVDITGVRTVDTHVADTLMRAAQAVRLLGAEIVITGIRAGVAQTLVGLGVDLRNIVTRRNLQGGIEHAEKIVSSGAHTV